MTLQRSLRFAAPSAAALLFTPATAGAFERQHHIGLDGGLALLKVADKEALSVGPLVGAHYTYALTDQFLVMAEGSFAQVAFKETVTPDGKTPKTRPTSVLGAGAGLGYVIDVLRWVPYFGVLAGAHFLGGGTMPSARALPSLQLGAGLDYQIDRSWTVGLSLRQAMMLVDSATYPSYTTVALRGEWVFGW